MRSVCGEARPTIAHTCGAMRPESSRVRAPAALLAGREALA